MPKIKVTGLKELEKVLKENATMDDVKKVVRRNGSQMQQKAQDHADFRGHYGWKKGVGRTFIPPTGKLKESIKFDIKDAGFTAEVEPHAKYAPYVELGTRFMYAQPYLRPAYDEQKRKFKRDMDKLVR